jgi:hypothetical protein
LVIGVGAYPHLKASGRGNRFGLGPLTSPSSSAIAIANWFAVDLARVTTNCECGSVELLMSHPRQNFEGTPTPTMKEIKAAGQRWISACLSDADSLAVFYFCGHGLYKNSHFLLCDDFGDPNESDEWALAIDLEGFRSQAERSGIQNLIGFADSCAQELFDPREDMRGQSLISARPPYRTPDVSAMYYAANAGDLAYGTSAGISDYAEAIIGCLNGLAAVNKNGTWDTDAHSLSTALVWLMEQRSLDSGEAYWPTQSLRAKCVPLFSYESGSVSARIELLGSPKEQASRARIEMQRGEQTFVAEAAEPKPIRRVVSPGDWTISIELNEQSFEEGVSFIPPVYSGIKPS